VSLEPEDPPPQMLERDDPPSQQEAQKPAQQDGTTSAERTALRRSYAQSGAIPKSISFDKTADRDDRDSHGDRDRDCHDRDGKHKRSFFKTLKSQVFKGRRKTNSMQYSHSLEEPLAEVEAGDRDRPATIAESSDDILAKYRNKQPQADEASPSLLLDVAPQSDAGVDDVADGAASEDQDATFAYAARRLRAVLSSADLLCSDDASPGLERWLLRQAASARASGETLRLADVSQLLTCLNRLPAAEIRRLIAVIVSERRRRAPFAAYLTRARQLLAAQLRALRTRGAAARGGSTRVRDAAVAHCVALHMERNAGQLAAFRREFTASASPDDKVQLVAAFLDAQSLQLAADADWKAGKHAIEAALEQYVMASVYEHALYPNGEADVSRDQVLRAHITGLGGRLHPASPALRIPAQHRPGCPWPLPQEHLALMAAQRSPAAKVACVVAACRALAAVLSDSGGVAAADDVVPCLIYCVVAANPRALLSQLQYVAQYHEARLQGEPHYCWTQFCAAVQFIKTMTAE